MTPSNCDTPTPTGWRAGPSPLTGNKTAVPGNVTGKPRNTKRSAVLETKHLALLGPLAALLLGACGPKAASPPLPPALPGAVADTASTARTAKALAPVLYLQRDESFQLSRAVAIVHPDSNVVAYHLLWRDDVHGAWLPGTVATDQEIVWVGHDATGAPVQVWTYWHGTVLTTRWPKRQVAIDVQWGKHGSLPRGTDPVDLPPHQSLAVFYAFAWALPDIWLGATEREGPLCFCRGYDRYRQFTRAEPLAPHLDAVVVARDADDVRDVLRRVFGARFSDKPAWPWS